MNSVVAVHVCPSFAMVTSMVTVKPLVALPMDRVQLTTPLGAAVPSHPVVVVLKCQRLVIVAPPGLPLVQLRTAVRVMLLFFTGDELFTCADAEQMSAVDVGVGDAVLVAAGVVGVGCTGAAASRASWGARLFTANPDAGSVTLRSRGPGPQIPVSFAKRPPMAPAGRK